MSSETFPRKKNLLCSKKQSKSNQPVVSLIIFLAIFRDWWDTAVSHRIAPASFLNMTKPARLSSRVYTTTSLPHSCQHLRLHHIMITTVKAAVVTSSTKSSLFESSRSRRTSHLANSRSICTKKLPNTLQTVPAFLASHCAALPDREV